MIVRRASTLVLALALAVTPLAAAQPEHGGHDDHAAEATHGDHGGEPMCTATSSDHACLEYWEHTINWWSWDYRKSPTQDPSHRHMPPPFGFALINFAVFGYILWRLAAQPLRDFVRTRHLTIRRDLDEAARLHREAEAQLAAYEAKIGGLDKEIEALLVQVRGEAESEKARIIGAAEKEAERLKVAAEAQIAREIALVRRELSAEAVAAAVARASELVARQATETDQARLTERFLADLEGTTAPSMPPPAASAMRS